MIIYEFLYCDCIHESSYATMSMHRTKEGAEKAMNEHKEAARKKHKKMTSKMTKHIMEDDKTPEKDKLFLVEHNESRVFGAHEDWAIGEQELLD